MQLVQLIDLITRKNIHINWSYCLLPKYLYHSEWQRTADKRLKLQINVVQQKGQSEIHSQIEDTIRRTYFSIGYSVICLIASRKKKSFNKKMMNWTACVEEGWSFEGFTVLVLTFSGLSTEQIGKSYTALWMCSLILLRSKDNLDDDSG